MLPYENKQGGADNLDRKKLNYMLPYENQQGGADNLDKKS